MHQILTHLVAVIDTNKEPRELVSKALAVSKLSYAQARARDLRLQHTDINHLVVIAEIIQVQRRSEDIYTTDPRELGIAKFDGGCMSPAPDEATMAKLKKFRDPLASFKRLDTEGQALHTTREVEAYNAADDCIAVEKEKERRAIHGMDNPEAVYFGVERYKAFAKTVGIHWPNAENYPMQIALVPLIVVPAPPNYFGFDAPDNDGWIEWKGGKCPVGPDVTVEIKTDNDARVYSRPAGKLRWAWVHGGSVDDIIKYRVVK
jgi:hypothetical protein